jgi:hypothetical protein
MALLLSRLRQRRAPVTRILRALCGRGRRGLVWYHDLLHTMQTMRPDDEASGVETQAGGEERPCARAWLAMLLEVFGLMERDKRGEFSLTGPGGFWGKQHRDVPRCRALVGNRRIELAHDLEQVGFSRDDAWTEACRREPETERVYVPKEEAGGLAARVDRSVRTVGRYAAIARAARFVGSRQPPAPGTRRVGGEGEEPLTTVMPRVGKFAYPVWRFLRAPPEALLLALRIANGEVKLEKPTPEAEPPLLGLTRQPRTVAGPRAPPLDVAAIAAASPDLDVIDDHDLLALAKLRHDLSTHP